MYSFNVIIMIYNQVWIFITSKLDIVYYFPPDEIKDDLLGFEGGEIIFFKQK